MSEALAGESAKSGSSAMKYSDSLLDQPGQQVNSLVKLAATSNSMADTWSLVILDGLFGYQTDSRNTFRSRFSFRLPGLGCGCH